MFVVLDCERKGRKSWVAWEEGGKLPDVVVELTSESTAHVDRGEKMAIYSRIWRTPAYFIFDPETRELEGYQLDATSRNYVRIAPDARGDLPVAPLGLSLGLRPTRYRHYEEQFVRWLDEHGEVLPTGSERAERERARAEQERARAEEALVRLRELEARRGRSDQ